MLLGIDIGTTTITALTCDEKTGETLKSATLDNNSFIKSALPFEKAQSPDTIIETVKKAVRLVTDGNDISAVGISGQMHGILYLDKSNVPVSPLYIWQDERGNEPFNASQTYAAFLTENSKYKAASGFGLTTHFYNVKNDLVPDSAVKLCTIHDYLAFVLTKKALVTHSSDAASLGFFDLKARDFDREELISFGISPDILPEVVTGAVLAGTAKCDFLKEGIPVAVAIGDNQASFLGSVSDISSTVLVNVGTGSQVSFATSSLTLPPVGEIRPLNDDINIFVGSSLCGGRAYAVLKEFFNQCADMLGGEKDNMFKKMDALACTAADCKNPLNVCCEFCGTRENPEKRGIISNIGTDNLTPSALIYGVLNGVASELYSMYSEANKLLAFTPKSLVGSGNGLRNSVIWRKIFSDMFGISLTVPTHREEAAVGACVFAAAASGIYDNIFDAQSALLK